MATVRALNEALSLFPRAGGSTEDGDRAPSQGGVIEGSNPSEYNPKDPLTIFIIQAGLILIMCHLLHWPLSKIRQPRVIAEVIGGIVLGPSVMGRIPNFRASIFPDDSIPNLTLVANLGLVLYLFLIGLETDVRFLVSNWRVASSVAFAGLALPFALGCALAWGLYNEFRNDEGVEHIAFSTYLLFIGVAIAITAFPVLCRILTELNLLGTSPGIITLSAGVANDVVGWILLALCVTLANAGNGLSALWILLATAGFLLFLLYAVKPALSWFLRWTGNIDHGPSQSIIAMILLIAFASAFFTAIIGIHAIFGGFMVGLIVPRDKSFAIKVTEKIEDLIGALFLPLYFTLSGLNTNLGLLDSGIAWGYVVAVTVTAFFSKIIGASLAARFSGLVWREALTVGALMSCKGLVELIVLNIGLQANILSTRTFTIFVVMALLTTFATTPITTLLYPPWYQKKIAAWKRGEIEWDSSEDSTGAESALAPQDLPTNNRIGQLLVYLRLDNMPGLLNLVSLFGQEASESNHAGRNQETLLSSDEKSPASAPTLPVKAHGLRLLTLGDRDSSVMTVSEVEEHNKNDPVVNTWRIVGQLLRVGVSGEVATMVENRFAEAILTKSASISADLLLLPWSSSGSMGDTLEHVPANRAGTTQYVHFTKQILDAKAHNVGIFFPEGGPTTVVGGQAADKGLQLQRAYSFTKVQAEIQPLPVKNKAHQIILPYFGGDDDKFALMLVLQLCEKTGASAKVIHLYGDSTPDSREYLHAISSSLPASVSSRVDFSFTTANDAAEEVLSSVGSSVRDDTADLAWTNLVVVGRSSAAGKLSSGKTRARASEEFVDCLGDAAGLLIGAAVKADVLVVQAKAPKA